MKQPRTRSASHCSLFLPAQRTCFISHRERKSVSQLTAARPLPKHNDISLSAIEKQKKSTRKSECFPLAPQTGLDSRACGRLVARGRNSPPDCCSVPLVLRVHFSSETTKHHPFGWCFVIGAPNRTRTCDTAVNSRVLYRLSY